LPGNRGVLFAQLRPGAAVRDIHLAVVDIESGKSHIVVPNALAGWYVESGHLLFVRPDGTLLATRFDLSSLKTTGDAVPVMDSVAINERLPMIAIARNGSVVMRSGGSLAMLAPHTFVWMNRDGSTSDVDPEEVFRLTSYGANRGWALSPDGGRVAVGINTEAGDDIYIKKLPRGPMSRLTFDGNSELRPRWSADGRFITYHGQRTSGMGLLRRSADGTGAEELLVGGNKGGIYEHQVSNDGKWLVLRRGGTINVVGSRNIQVQQIGTDTEPRDFIANPAFDESAFSLSPDNRWIVFESNETGATEVYIRPFPGVDAGKWQVSNGGGRAPLWSRNGRELYFVNANREMVAVALTPTTTEPGAGAQKVLFKLGPEFYLTLQENYVPYDIGADGRFLMAKRVDTKTEAPVIPVVFIDNWFEELRRRLGNR
jgi:eukaryotic-like serine/threonine-protein kinase